MANDGLDPLAATVTPPPAPSGASALEVDATVASQPAGVSATDETISNGGPGSTGGAAGPTAVTIAAGGDYVELQTVEARHYIVERELARGGMGRILVARDRRLGRPVALKELLAQTPGLDRRFEREARITSRLQHPGIVNVHEAGRWPSGEPFYAMKLVAGRPLDAVIREATTTRDRLALLPTIIDAVDALAYAHSHRVIHRDLKPGNVLVGDFGETVVIDWGLAKDLGVADLEPMEATPYRASGRPDDRTVDGAVLGTPAFMPPEQARGEAADERADVYALGAILYLALSGQRPYPQRDLDGLLAAVLAGPPPPLAEVAPEIPADLAAIVGKAMAFDAGDRYPTAQELAADLKRFQTGQLVGVHRYGLWELVRRWARRHRGALAVAGLATVVVIALVVIGVQRIVAERDRARSERAAAVSSRAAAEDLVGFMLFDLHDRLQAIGRLELFDTVANKALDYYDHNAAAAGGDDALRRRATAQRTLGETLFARGDLAGAKTRYEAAMALVDAVGERRLAGEDWGRVYLLTRDDLIELQVRQGDLAGAVTAYRALRAELDARPGQDAWLEEARSVTAFRLGVVLAQQGDLAGALEAQAASLAIDRRLVATDDSDARRKSLAASLSRYGEVQLATGDLDGAQRSFEEGLALATRRVAEAPKDADRVHSLGLAEFKLGELAETRKDHRGALTHFQRVADVASQLVAIDPTNLDWQDLVATTYSKIGDMDQLLGDIPSATAAFARYVEAATRTAAADPTNQARKRSLALAYFRSGPLRIERGDREGGEAELRKGIALEEERAAAGSTPDAYLDLSWAHTQLGEIARAHHEDDLALRELQAGVDAGARLVATAPGNVEWAIDLAEGRYFVGRFLEDHGRHGEATATYRQCVADVEAAAAGDGAHNALVEHAQADASTLWEAVARSELADGHAAEAADAARRAMRYTATLVADHPDRPAYRHDNATQPVLLGDALRRSGDRDGAAAAYHQAIDDYVATGDEAAAAAVRAKLAAR